MPQISYEINLMLTRSANYIFTESTGAGTFTVTDAELNILVVNNIILI